MGDGRMSPFKVGDQYTRKDILSSLSIEDPGGGTWYTGYTSHEDDWYIFCGIGIPGRTGHVTMAIIFVGTN